MIWRIHFQKGMNCFEANLAKEWNGNPWIFAGDKNHVDRARENFSVLVNSRGRGPHQVDHFKLDWEPFEVIRDMLREVDKNKRLHKQESIGGAPQVLKIYEHLSSRYLAVDWNISSQENGDGVYVCGRKILSYESPSLWILNPDTLVTRHPFYSEAETEFSEEQSEEEPYDLKAHSMTAANVPSNTASQGATFGK